MPLRATDAKKLFRRLLSEGRLISPEIDSHAREEMNNDDLTDIDIVNVLRGGVVKEPRWKDKSWRYLVETTRMSFVVVIEPDPEHVPNKDEDLKEMHMSIITGWRMRQ